MSGKKPGRPFPMATIVLLGVFVFLLFELLGSSCFFARVFGIPCAGCGSSRAFSLLLRGQFRDALRMHPLILVSLTLLFVIFLFLVMKLLAIRRGKPLQVPLSSGTIRIILFSLITLYLLVYLIRMILYFPHTEPMCYRQDSVWGRLIALIGNLFRR
ncbi:MAG: DUF2752 domain-containing protein [Clostridiaceae bacterium]|jgi:hypothetical protein|nr:DUF2752 domain-containing protein [Clostridiaceae bacterium]